MWKFLSSFIWKKESVDNLSLHLDEAYAIIKECEDKLPNEIVDNVEKDEDIGQYEVFNKIGKVTFAEDNKFKVDDLYDFTTDLQDISVGTKISYQLIRSDGEIKVVDVRILENDWNVTQTGKQKWHERVLICTVKERNGRLIILSPGDLSVNLNNVCSEFIPIEGDWVELEVKCEIDENVVDLNGKLIEITGLQPLRTQVKLGRVTIWDFNTDTGQIDTNIFFNKDSLYSGYLPVKGDKVVAEIIESNQGSCTWRALKVLPDHLRAVDIKSSKINEEDLSESNDIVRINNNVSLTFSKLGETKLFLMEIQSKEDIQLVCVELPRINGQCCLSDNVDHFKIKANTPLTIRLECKAKCAGESRELIIFHFENFKIKRWVTINVTVNKNQNNIKERNGFVQKQYVSREKRQTIRGQRIKCGARFVSLKIPEHPVPERLLDLVTKTPKLEHNSLKAQLEKIKPCLASTLSYFNFEDKFHTLLFLDEIGVMLEMRNYDQAKACFIKSGEFLLLEIENLAERRPSVIPGDRVIARNSNDEKSPNYEGVIHKTARNHLYIKFSQIFHDTYDGEDYSIYLVASRVTYKRKHFAINLAVRNLGKEWLFPTKVVEKEPQLEFVFDSYVDSLDSCNDDLEEIPEIRHNALGKKRLLEKIQKFHEKNEDLPVRKLEWFNKSLNFYQKEAVRNILLGVCRPLPYIIFGPPGTGKTVTIVETVLQILRLMPHSRILLCAPSNSASDLLALRLIDTGVLKPGDLIRLLAHTAISTVSPKLAPYCATANIEKEGTQTSLPVVTASGLVLGYSSAVLGRHRITVSTCSSAGLLYAMGFSKGHFSHVIVDEAGQTSEPSLLIPLAFLDISTGQAILAGDPMQLGPVVLSPFAAEYGLEESFLERMINRFPYMRDSQGFPKTCGYDPRLITKLIYNYRSLPVLLKLPSIMFYNDDLKPTILESDCKEIKILEQVEEILPKNKHGQICQIVFHGVKGENFQAEDSPSWFNPNEASQVFFYVNELYRLGLRPNDIGIITPYKAQTRKLMNLFREAEFESPKVGTVEDFQGQEYNVIILSTVRSNKKYIESDVKFSIGFISSPRRINVSITRAKSLLILIGNPTVLSTDRCWRSVINYSIENGGVIGYTPNGI